MRPAPRLAMLRLPALRRAVALLVLVVWWTWPRQPKDDPHRNDDQLK